MGFPHQQKGFYIYVSTTCQDTTSTDVIFYEDFTTAIAQTWQHFNDSLALIPTTQEPIPSGIPEEHTCETSNLPQLDGHK